MGLLAERAALREDASRLLDELGGTAHEVEVSLGCIGIQVRRSNPNDSPPARYLHAVIGADNRVRQRLTESGLRPSGYHFPAPSCD
jgi:hypothetical protein